MLIVVEHKKLWLRWLKIKNCHSFPKRIFVYWKSKKLEETTKNILRSFHYTATPIRRAMECLNVNKMFETLFTFCNLRRKCIWIRNHVWEKRANAFGFSQTINHWETTVHNERFQSHFTNEKSGILGCDKCSKKFQIKAGTDKWFHMGASQNTVIASTGWSIKHVFTGPISQSIMGKLQLILKDFNQILLTSRLVCLVVVNVSKCLK